MSYPTLHSYCPFTSTRTLGELRLQWQTKQFDDPFAIDDYGGQQVLNLHSQSPPIAYPSPGVPADQFRQLPLDARMLAAHLLIGGRLRALLRSPVLRFVGVLEHGAAPLGFWFETPCSQGTRAALGGAEAELPAVPPPGALARAGRHTARTAHFIPRGVEGESLGLRSSPPTPVKWVRQQTRHFCGMILELWVLQHSLCVRPA